MNLRGATVPFLYSVTIAKSDEKLRMGHVVAKRCVWRWLKH